MRRELPLPGVFGKTLHDQGRGLVAWAVFTALLAAFYLALYPSLGSMGQMQDIIDAMPAEFRALFMATGLDLSTATGYLNVELFSFVLPFVAAGYGAAVGAAAIAGEEERGTFDLLLSNPVTRWRVVVEKSLAMIVGMGVIGVAMWLAVLGTAVALDIELDAGGLAAGLTSGGLLGIAFGSIAMIIGAATGRRTLSLAASLGLAVVAYVVNAMSALVDWLEPWRVLSPIYHYIGNDPLTNGLDAGSVLVLVGIAVVAIGGTIVVFERRDIHG